MNALTNDLSRLGQASRRYLDTPQRMFIGGRFVEAGAGRTFPVIDPSSGLEVAQVPEGDARDIDIAVAAARRAFDGGPWRQLRPSERERIMLRLADLLAHHAQEFSEIESVNSGRTLQGTRLIDVDLSVDYLRYMAGWATKIHGQTLSPSTPYSPHTRFFAMTLREPVGVVGAITPWNVPLGQAIWKIAPALATGCTLVLKPAEQTPLTALRFAQLIADAGVPEGVINIVTGFGGTAGAALVSHPGVDKISFTGSTEIGRQIGALAAAQMKRFTLELGGKSPMVVMDDADLEVAIPGTAMGIFANHGQNCCAGSRLFVHERVYERVTEGIAEIAARIKLGPALDPATEMGPLISARQQKRVLEYIASGRSEGAEVLVGGGAPDAPGCYVQPTVLTRVKPSMRVVREEIFGPVLTATSFSEVGEVIRRANDTQFGLGASIWTRSLDLAHGFIREFKAGTVWVNSHNVLDLAVPFGGHRQSGVGHELGEAAIEHHTHLKAAMLPMRDLQ
ncbi:MAG: aldehyde dehydrogenase family protein [Pseudomonadota bacterium]|nr:aldehyde dehydrogenase family protein [Pseudomonadota bacterium]